MLQNTKPMRCHLFLGTSDRRLERPVWCSAYETFVTQAQTMLRAAFAVWDNNGYRDLAAFRPERFLLPPISPTMASSGAWRVTIRCSATGKYILSGPPGLKTLYDKRN